MHGADNNLCAARLLSHAANQFETVDVGQFEVDNANVERAGGKMGKQLRARLRKDNVPDTRMLGDKVLQSFQNKRVVICNDYV